MDNSLSSFQKLLKKGVYLGGLLKKSKKKTLPEGLKNYQKKYKSLKKGGYSHSLASLLAKKNN